MRSKNALKNLVFYLTYEVFLFILGIVFPRYIILTYGSEINGLTSTVSRILSLINLIQAGAVGTAIFQMYKPVAEDDYEKQSEIIYSSKMFYNKVSVTYLALSLGVGVFYSLYLKNESLSFIEIFLSFAILAINGTGVLLFNSVYDIFISSHQKRYLLSISAIVALIVQYGFLTVVLLTKLPFVFIYISSLAGGIVSIALNSVFYYRLGKGRINKNPNNKEYKIPDRKYLMLSSVGSEAVTMSPTLIITTFIGLVQSSVFSVYAMVFTSMKTILNSIQLSFASSFGNLVKTSSEERVEEVHSTIELITIVIGTIVACGVGFLIIPFVFLYSRGTDVNYVYNVLGIFVLTYTVIFTFRTSFGYVATVYGLFKDLCIITLAFGAVGIVVSIICTIFFGMPFVMIGLIINQLGCSIATLTAIKKKIPWFRINKLIVRSLVMMGMSVLSFVSFALLNPTMDSWFHWIFYALIVVLVASLFLFLYCFIFERKYLKLLAVYLKTVFTRG